MLTPFSFHLYLTSPIDSYIFNYSTLDVCLRLCYCYSRRSQKCNQDYFLATTCICAQDPLFGNHLYLYSGPTFWRQPISVLRTHFLAATFICAQDSLFGNHLYLHSGPKSWLLLVYPRPTSWQSSAYIHGVNLLAIICVKL